MPGGLIPLLKEFLSILRAYNEGVQTYLWVMWQSDCLKKESQSLILEDILLAVEPAPASHKEILLQDDWTQDHFEYQG